MRRRLPAVVAIMLAASAAPAFGVGVNVRGGPVGYDVDDTGEACFTHVTRGSVQAVATAVGLVTVGPLEELMTIHTTRGTQPTRITDVADRTTKDYVFVCVGGTGRRVVGGSVVFTFTAHGTTSDLAEVLVCRYTYAGPHCT
ncbi:MAG TPA: hypothetical protein VNQ77_08595 [Frankiaceae bacterium]|nr:hypothetical protein [Frankiaceae bacterium]